MASSGDADKHSGGFGFPFTRADCMLAGLNRIQAAHIFIQYQTLGGVESILRHHYDCDAQFGIDSEFFIHFDPVSSAIPRVHPLGVGDDSSMREARRRFAAAVGGKRFDIALYHALWGMPFLADLDHAARRVAVLHAEVPGLRELVADRRRWLDGVLCVSEALLELARSALPGFPEERLQRVYAPINPPQLHEKPQGGEFVFGYCGRVQVEQKRVDLLPQVVAALEKHGVPFRFEVLGDGADRAWLEGQFAGAKNVVVHGRKSGEDYWRILNAWDAILFTSDYEGTPVALIEALALGVVAVYPLLPGGGDEYVRQVDANLLFPKGDCEAAAAALASVARLPLPEREKLRERARAAVTLHRGDNYSRSVLEFVNRIAKMPALKTDRRRFVPFPVDRLSFVKVAKLSRAARRIRRGFR